MVVLSLLIQGTLLLPIAALLGLSHPARSPGGQSNGG
jgi:hypothetical protein